MDAVCTTTTSSCYLPVLQMVLHMFNKCFAESSDVQNYIHAFSSFVIRSAYVLLVLTSGPQKDISVPSSS